MNFNLYTNWAQSIKNKHKLWERHIVTIRMTLISGCPIMFDITYCFDLTGLMFNGLKYEAISSHHLILTLHYLGKAESNGLACATQTPEIPGCINLNTDQCTLSSQFYQIPQKQQIWSPDFQKFGQYFTLVCASQPHPWNTTDTCSWEQMSVYTTAHPRSVTNG